MPDSETLRRIDTARDILVGKVPDPKSQVEQITIALVYKFMDDMDQDSIARGGSPSFFTGEYARYAWSSIFNPRLGGQEMLNLYADAITQMTYNTNLPALFRSIFKNAFLPYRDPETLKLFLKTINEFRYEHSEDLGDAFEYLLSIMSSQGEAGQFRTPRHIIDFMVRVVQPQAHETILDPACGTAGFLISAYKYILAANQNQRPGDRLTPLQRTRLLDNFTGYDISPDMVRLSLVNLYLHGFTREDIHIHEYDTLTSLDRWNDYADVILANPPFMSPKGGIRPHTRFSVPSNRSEVLFVDYIAEHLTPHGRGAVIVPEGIIFQSGKAYKDLRKYLVEKGFLWAVASLPAGVFNPYSGVKTSILFFDKALARRTSKILFVKITADGYDLGAQRRKNGKDDLPAAQAALEAWRSAARAGEETAFDPAAFAVQALPVEKSRLAENGEYNLSADRLKQVIHDSRAQIPFASLENHIEYVRGVTYSKTDEVTDGGVVVLRANNIDAVYNKLNLGDLRRIRPLPQLRDNQKLKQNDILICAASGSVEHIGKVAFSYIDTDFYIGGFMGVIRTKGNVEPEYLFHMLCNKHFREHIDVHTIGINIRNLSLGALTSFEIPLPPLDVQRQIVDEIAGYQRIIDGARQVVENWKPQIENELAACLPDGLEAWPIDTLGNLCTFMTGGTPSSKVKEYYVNGTVPWLVSGDIHKGEIKSCEGRITFKGVENSNARFLPKDSVLIALNGQGKTRATVGILRMDKATCNQSLVSINPKDKGQLLSEFLYYSLKSKYQDIRNLTGDNQRSGLNIPIIKTISIPLPPLDVQREIVARIERERAIVEANRELIEIYQQKITAAVNRVWESA